MRKSIIMYTTDLAEAIDLKHIMGNVIQSL